MLKIRPEQLSAFARAITQSPAQRDYLESMVAWVRSTYWRQLCACSKQEAAAMVRDLLCRGVSYGLETPDHHRAFIALEFLHGPSFDSTSDYIHRTLTDSTLSGGAKLALVEQRLEAYPDASDGGER